MSVLSMNVATASTKAKVGLAPSAPAVAGCADVAAAGTGAANPRVWGRTVTDEAATSKVGCHSAQKASVRH